MEQLFAFSAPLWRNPRNSYFLHSWSFSLPIPEGGNFVAVRPEGKAKYYLVLCPLKKSQMTSLASKSRLVFPMVRSR